MSAVLTPQPTAPAGRFGGLLRAEVHRWLARRFIRVLLVLTLVGWVTALVISLLSFQAPTQEGLATARQLQHEQIQAGTEGREQCLADPNRPAGTSAEEWCGPPVTEQSVPLSMFLQPAPFSLADDAGNGAVSVAAVAAALAFLVGGTFVGAEWSSRSMVALLFWETRRPRVMAAKLLVTTAASMVLGLAMQALWLGLATLLQAVAGDGVPPPGGFWSELLGAQGRGVLLTVFAGLLGFGLTNLLRNTGAATGVAFVYVAIVETAVRALRPAWQPWLLTNDAAALILPDGLTLTWPGDAADPLGVPGSGIVEYLLTNGQAAVYLAVVTAVVVGVGVVLFSRRDLH
jgi:ABC-type transport system involved in multi-copper enzyme maturation permease subunit